MGNRLLPTSRRPVHRTPLPRGFPESLRSLDDTET